MSSTADRNIICVQMSAEDQIRLDKAAGTYEANIAADPKYYLALGDFQTIPVGMNGNPEQYVELLRQALPEVNTIRICFNEFSFNPDGTLHPQFERFLTAAANAGLDFILGPTGHNAQRLGEDGSLNAAQMRDGLRHEVLPAMSHAWSQMLDWLDAHPKVAHAIYGLELMNEPAAYARAEGMCGNTGEFVRMYADHMLALADMIQSRTDAHILVGGWGYSASFDVFATTPYGNGTVLDALRQDIGDALVWSAHLYPTWVSENIQSVHMLGHLYDKIFGILGDDNIILTETNAAGIAVDDYTDRSTVFDMARAYGLLTDLGIGIGWFQGVQAGGSNLAVIDTGGAGGVRYLHPNSLAHALNAYSLDETDPLFAGDDRLTATLLPGRVRHEATLQFLDVDGIGTAFGRDGNDSLTGLGHAVNMLYGGRGNDTLLGMESNDHLFGQDGNDSLQGQQGDDILLGGRGNDTLIADLGHDILTGATGADVFRITQGSHVITDYNSTDDHDSLFLGQDLMSASELLAAGRLLDIDHDGFVDDLLLTVGPITVKLIDFQNVIPDEMVNGTSGADFIDTDYTDYEGEQINWRGSIVKAGAGNDFAEGAMGNDVLYGEAGNDTLRGREGNDLIYGGDGSDTMLGGTGADTLQGGLGDDLYIVGDLRDRMIELHNGGTDAVHSALSYTLSAEIENLVLTGTADIDGSGNTMNNDMLGSAGTNLLLGGLGNDTIAGREGDDTIKGGVGDDVLQGGLGADRLMGELGADRLTGAADADTFVLRVLAESTVEALGRDVITDFRLWQGDRVDLSSLDARADQAGNQAFRFIGASSFSGTAGELNAKAVNGGVLVSGDVDGNHIPDFSLLLAGVDAVDAGAFLL